MTEAERIAAALKDYPPLNCVWVIWHSKDGRHEVDAIYDNELAAVDHVTHRNTLGIGFHSVHKVLLQSEFNR